MFLLKKKSLAKGKSNINFEKDVNVFKEKKCLCLETEKNYRNIFQNVFRYNL